MVRLKDHFKIIENIVACGGNQYKNNLLLRSEHFIVSEALKFAKDVVREVRKTRKLS